MHRIATVGIGLLLGCSMTEHCSAASAVKPDADRPPAVTASPDELKLAESANAGFALDLYGQLAKEHPGENLFFSPFSVSSALLIAAEGASGQTAEQMGKVLHVPSSLRNTGANAASIPWQLGPLDKGQAAMTYRLSPEPASPELRMKIDQLKRDLDAANQQTVSLERTEKWQEAQKSHAAAKKLAAELNPLLKQTEPYEWRAANALWAEKTYPFRPTYLDTIRAVYGDVLKPVDFHGHAEAARGEINSWVSQQTHDRIKDLMPPGSIDSATRLVITNAVYFKGEWLDPFDESATQPKNFHLADGSKVQTPMMSKYEHYASYGAFDADGKTFDTPRMIPVTMSDDDPSLYPDAHGFTAVRLRYKGNKLFMVIIVPRSADGLAAIEAKLPQTGLQQWIDRIVDRTVIVNVPKFKLEAEYGLEKSLAGLGMVRAFNNPIGPDGAQFDRMTTSTDPAQQLYISAVRHKTFVEVNEKGTEAAAATGIAMAAASARLEQPKTRPFIPTFWADKPFLFAICDKDSGSILFLGRMVTAPPK
jgi:serine protease inhibitor